ncbi:MULTISPECIES: hypothetical protein [unclassified Streptomyces]|uniref:hypothetical protein n=1 Tax=unclassified Streptomyces TaxID=2593676 RepID=UPI00114CEF93|nr:MULTISPECIES: hypothetical protein [unclassified Streptomyces]MYS19176.1 hypothetical protein [Streptomyces sp. SID4948]
MTKQTPQQQAIGKILLRGGRGTLGSTAACTLWLDAIPELVSVVQSKFTAEELDTITAGVVPGNERKHVPEKDTGPAGESTPPLRAVGGRYRRITLDVLETILYAVLEKDIGTQTEGTRIVRGPRDKDPAGSLRLEFDDGQVFYVDVQEEER